MGGEVNGTEDGTLSNFSFNLQCITLDPCKSKDPSHSTLGNIFQTDGIICQFKTVYEMYTMTLFIKAIKPGQPLMDELLNKQKLIQTMK